ncbi:UV excision repair protein RAD23 A, partial [Entophlyctis luteolus]
MFGQFSASTFQVAYIFYSWKRAETAVEMVFPNALKLMNLLYTIAPVVYFLEVVPHFILIAQGFRGGSDSNSDELLNMLLVTADGLGTLFTCAFDTVLVIAFLRVLQGREFGIDTMVLRASAASESQRCERQAVSTSRMSGFSKKRFVVVAKYGIASVVCAAVLMTLFMIASFQSDAVVFVSLTATVDLLMIAQLKDRVQSAQGFPAVQQKLIYAGKILADDATVESSGISEAGFIVVMVTKPKAASTSTAPTAPVSQISSSVPEPVPAVSAPDAPALEAEIATGPVPVPDPTSAAAPIATDVAVVSATFDASTLATGDAYQRAVQNLIEMGFPAEQVARAMKAAYNNPDRAAEYLMTGIPENIESIAAPESRSTAPTSAALATAAATGEIPAPPIEGGY